MKNYYLSTASTVDRKPLQSNLFAWTLLSVFLSYWVYGWFNCILMTDWILENLLVVICLTLLLLSHRWHQLSDFSYLCVFVFVMLHLYGAFYAYTRNNLGEWMRELWHLSRNPYDRIVHFSFGLLLAYPYRELLIRKFGVSARAAWIFPVEIAFSLGTVFEMIEWGVAASTDSVTGDTYVATQGDVWDAHKDIALAALGAGITMLLLFVYKRVQVMRPGLNK